MALNEYFSIKIVMDVFKRNIVVNKIFLLRSIDFPSV